MWHNRFPRIVFSHRSWIQLWNKNTFLLEEVSNMCDVKCVAATQQSRERLPVWTFWVEQGRRLTSRLRKLLCNIYCSHLFVFFICYSPQQEAALRKAPAAGLCTALRPAPPGATRGGSPRYTAFSETRSDGGD